MFIAHLPAGYLLTRGLRPRPSAWHYAIGLVGSVFPDVDLAYFYLVDHRRHAHHSYWTHVPIFWVAVAAVGLLVAGAARSRAVALGTALFVANALLHLVLDSVAGGIEWLAPLSSRSYVLFRVPASYHPWFYNFFLHWTFLLELAIVAAAAVVWVRSRRRTPEVPPV